MTDTPLILAVTRMTNTPLILAGARMTNIPLGEDTLGEHVGSPLPIPLQTKYYRTIKDEFNLIKKSVFFYHSKNLNCFIIMLVALLLRSVAVVPTSLCLD